MKKVRFATVGTSMITNQFLEAITFVDTAQLVAVYSRDLAKATSLAKEHGAAHAYADFYEMLADKTIDAVYIASPNSLHYHQTRAAILAGKHVLCEKPLATSAEDTASLIELARAHNVILLEAMRLVFDPNYQTIHKLIDRLDGVKGATLHYCKHSSRYDALKAGEFPNIFNPRFCAGALMDLGVYPISAALYLFGAPLDLVFFATTEPVLDPDERIDVSGQALLDYGDFVAHVAYDKTATLSLPCAIYGKGGTITWEGVGQARRISFIDPDGTSEEIALVHGKNNTNHEVGNMEFEIATFCDCVMQSKEPTAPLEITLAAAQILERIRIASGVTFPIPQR